MNYLCISKKHFGFLRQLRRKYFSSKKYFKLDRESFVYFIKVFVVNILNIICKFILLSPCRQIKKYAMIGYNSLKCFYMIM